MSADRDPWRQPQPQSPRPGSRLFVRLLLLAALGIGAWRLSVMFPGALASDLDRAYVLQLIVVLAVVASSLLFARRIAASELLRNLAIWAAVAVLLAGAFTYRDELQDFATRVRSELVPGEPVALGEKELALSRSADGHFYVFGEANGTRVRFLIDTGASDTVLSPADASRIGVDVKGLDFARPYGTANGVGFGAAYTLALLTIGPIEVADMPISINQAAMGSSLLGMSFLRRLASFEIRGNRLYLRQK